MTEDTTRQLHLNLHLSGAGHHEGAWRLSTEAGVPHNAFEHSAQVARLAERAKVDAVFLADIPSLAPGFAHREPYLEPFTLLSGLAGVTQQIGLIATVSTTYFEPYNLARLFASLDNISGGRAGWNIVTTVLADAARQFGSKPHPPHADRYRNAEEFVEVVTKLWDSWEDDAILADPRSGIYADPAKVHEIGHVGPAHQVAGPLSVQRSPQGHPVLMQAGSSAAGIAFAARYAEAVFTSLHSLEAAQTYYADLKGQMARLGRDPEDLVVLPGLNPVIGETEAKAREAQEELFELTNPAAGLAMLRIQTGGIDFSDLSLDAPFPRLSAEAADSGSRQRIEIIDDVAQRGRLTLREMAKWMATGHGHRVIVGTPEQIADDIEAWFRGRGADGFTLQPPYLPGGLELFIEHVIPELRRRGLFRSDYEGTTLREHYGLRRPYSRYAKGPAGALA